MQQWWGRWCLGLTKLLGVDEGLAVMVAMSVAWLIFLYVHSTSLVCRSLLPSLVVSHFCFPYASCIVQALSLSLFCMVQTIIHLA